MRIVLAFAIVLCLAGCETSPLGGRCTSNFDCDRATTGATSSCVSASNPASTCPSTSSACICCPIRVVTADGGIADSGVPGCGPGIAVVDAGDVQPTETGVDAAVDTSVDAPEDTGSDVATGCVCAAGMYCNGSLPDGGFACAPQKAIGLSCLGATECQTDHCVDGVCCNSACTGPGLSCNVSPDFAGLCSPEPTVDAGTDVATDVTTDAATE